MYVQCKVKYEDGFSTVLWIEDKFAKLNKNLYDEDTEKQCVVLEVYENYLKTKDQIRKMERMFKSFKEHDGAYK